MNVKYQASEFIYSFILSLSSLQTNNTHSVAPSALSIDVKSNGIAAQLIFLFLSENCQRQFALFNIFVSSFPQIIARNLQPESSNTEQ